MLVSTFKYQFVIYSFLMLLTRHMLDLIFFLNLIRSVNNIKTLNLLTSCINLSTLQGKNSKLLLSLNVSYTNKKL